MLGFRLSCVCWFDLDLDEPDTRVEDVSTLLRQLAEDVQGCQVAIYSCH